MTTFKIFAILTMIALTTLAYSQDRSKMLLGKWKVQELTAEYPASLSVADKLKSEMDLDKFSKRFKSSPMIFGQDSSLSVMGKDAKWALEKDGLHIRIILMAQEELTVKIISLNRDQLKFSVMDHDITEYFTMVKIKNY